MFNAATFIQNLTYVCFGIILTQFYVNYSRQKHQIDVLYVLYVICLKHIKKEQKKTNFGAHPKHIITRHI